MYFYYIGVVKKKNLSKDNYETISSYLLVSIYIVSETYVYYINCQLPPHGKNYSKIWKFKKRVLK